MSTAQLKQIEVTQQAITAVANKVARDIMATGDEYGQACKRIQFKLGDYPDEQDAGGLCEHALANVVASSLREQLSVLFG